MSFIVAIDGPAGTGKGTIANIISKKYKFINVDTGAMYRCVALKTIKENIDINDIDRIKELLNNIDIRLEENGKVFLDNEDVTDKIRTPEINAIVSPVSAIIEVREKLGDLQRKMGLENNLVMEGRDIGTVVFPNANLKIYLDASEEERANRRFKQNKEKGIDVSFEEVLKSIHERDELDKAKKVGALKQADDAIYIDSTNMTIEEVENTISKLIDERMK